MPLSKDVPMSPMAFEMERLSPEQRGIIRKSYKFMEAEATKNGLGLFVRLFAEYPHYKNIWPQLRAIPDSSLTGCTELKSHATVYMNGLKHIVNVMDDDIALYETVKKIARSHVKWQIQKYHIEHMVPELLTVLNTCMDGKMTPEISEAWSILYDVIGNMVNALKKEQIAVARRNTTV